MAYIFWQVATLGSIDSTTFMGLLANHAGLNGLLQALREMVASPHVELAVHLFADLALATSFLGVALGLFDYLADFFSVQIPLVDGYELVQLLSAAVGVCTVLSTRICDGAGLRRCGAGGTGIDYPFAVDRQSRKHNPQAGYRVKGGRPALVVVVLCGIAVIGVQFLIAAGLLPEVG